MVVDHRLNDLLIYFGGREGRLCFDVFAGYYGKCDVR